jgi:uncharacterized membrane protein
MIVKNSNSVNSGRIEALLPPPELLERYKELGMGTSLIEVIKAEQKHRHGLQNKYAVSYRIGQILGAVVVLTYLRGAFRLISNGMQRQAYILTSILCAFVLLAVFIVRRKKDIVAYKRANRLNNAVNGANNRDGVRQNSNYRR